MLRGLSTVSLFADDVMAARAWYAELLGIEPYFVRSVQVERGPGFVTASVTDPFGNILGIMYNQHYLEVLGS